MTFCMPEDQLWSAEGLADKRLADKGFACMLAKEACMRASLALAALLTYSLRLQCHC